MSQKILIVEDEAINIQALAEVLRPHYQVKIATTGKRALELIELHQPDLILLDIALPDISGYELCRKLKKDPTTKGLPIIFITAKDSVEDEAYGLSLGAADYIGKPYHMPVVLARINNHLDLKRKTDLLERLAAIDGLTNLYNRRRFDEVLAEEWKRVQRAPSPLSLILIDIDHFKEYNDRYGHAGGDQCLREVARALELCAMRSADLVARIGGEEFAVIMPNTALEGAVQKAEIIRKNIEALAIPHEASLTGHHVSASLGVSTLAAGSGSSAQWLLEQADHFLYQAKRAGRNRVCSQP